MSEKQKRVEVTLAKAHTHAGARHAAGARIQVTEPERDWLAAHEIIVRPAAPAKEGAK